MIDLKRVPAKWKTVGTIAALCGAAWGVHEAWWAVHDRGYRAGYRDAEPPRLEMPDGWQIAFAGFASDGGRHFFLCGTGMRSLADLSVVKVGTFSTDGIEILELRLNPMTPTELKVAEAILEKACWTVEAYQK